MCDHGAGTGSSSLGAGGEGGGGGTLIGSTPDYHTNTTIIDEASRGSSVSRYPGYAAEVRTDYSDKEQKAQFNGKREPHGGG